MLKRIVACLIISLIAVSYSFGQEARLAREYFSNGEFEKAAELYKNLHEKDRGNEYYYERYYLTLLELQDYKTAEQVVKKVIKLDPNNVQRYVDYGMLFDLQYKPEKANEQYEKAIKMMPNDQTRISKLATAFINNKKYDYAVETYEKGEKMLKEKNIFSYELGNVYRLKGDIPMMITSYLDCLEYLPNQLTNIQAFFKRYVEPSEGGYMELKTQLYARLQKNNGTIYSEMLIWVFIQEGDYTSALREAKALDKRLNENGTRIYRLAQTAISERNYDAGIEAYSYLVEKGIDCPYYIDAKQRLLAAKRDKLVDGYDYTEEDLLSLEMEYESFLDEFGRNRNTAAIMQELAEFESLYLNDLDKAINILNEVISLPNLSRLSRAEAKIDLGDYYLMKGEVWEATLLYSQVDKEMKDAPLGEMARYKNARLSYYRGEFDWSQDQLKVLKGSTSELISNDAIHLSVFIMDHLGLDTTARTMQMFADADLLIFQNRFSDAESKMDSILTEFEGHGLEDDIYYAKANIQIKKRNFEKAVDYLETIIEKHEDGILVDNAIFLAAELYEKYLNQPEVAMNLYQQILIDHSGSTFVVEARKRFRRLRGDNI